MNRSKTCKNLELAHMILLPQEEHPELYDKDGNCLMCKRLGI